MIETSQELSARESYLIDNERDENRLVREHAEAMKRLELEVTKENNQAQIKLKELESKWQAWLRFPSMVIKLPLYVLLGIAYICSMFTKKEHQKRFWDLLD